MDLTPDRLFSAHRRFGAKGGDPARQRVERMLRELLLVRVAPAGSRRAMPKRNR